MTGNPKVVSIARALTHHQQRGAVITWSHDPDVRPPWRIVLRGGNGQDWWTTSQAEAICATLAAGERSPAIPAHA